MFALHAGCLRACRARLAQCRAVGRIPGRMYNKTPMVSHQTSSEGGDLECGGLYGDVCAPWGVVCVRARLFHSMSGRWKIAGGNVEQMPLVSLPKPSFGVQLAFRTPSRPQAPHPHPVEEKRANHSPGTRNPNFAYQNMAVWASFSHVQNLWVSRFGFATLRPHKHHKPALPQPVPYTHLTLPTTLRVENPVGTVVSNTKTDNT